MLRWFGGAEGCARQLRRACEQPVEVHVECTWSPMAQILTLTLDLALALALALTLTLSTYPLHIVGAHPRSHGALGAAGACRAAAVTLFLARSYP